MNYIYSVISTILISIVLSYIEIAYESGERGKAVFCGDSFLYVLVVSFGNVVSTLLAPTVLGPSDALSEVAGLPWFWYSFVGVFGFSLVARNLDVDFLGKGILSIKEWVSKSKDNAVASVVERAVNIENDEAQGIANALREMDESDLEAQIIQVMGKEDLKEIISQSSVSNVNSHFHKALVLAHEETTRARAIVNSIS